MDARAQTSSLIPTRGLPFRAKKKKKRVRSFCRSSSLFCRVCARCLILESKIYIYLGNCLKVVWKLSVPEYILTLKIDSTEAM